MCKKQQLVSVASGVFAVIIQNVSFLITTILSLNIERQSIYDISRAVVLAFRLVGRGHAAANDGASILNLPSPVTSGPWTAHTKTLKEAADDLLERHLQEAVLELKRFKITSGEVEV